MKLSYAALSIAGTSPPNQDFIGFWQDQTAEGLAVALLADGVGGLPNGEEASRLAVETGLQTFCASPPEATLRQRLLQVFNAANEAVYREGHQAGRVGPMATTLAAAAFARHEVAVGNVGDSRVYLVHRGLIKQLSVDHSIVGIQRRFGQITEAESRLSQHRHVITRGLGVGPHVRVDMDQVPVFAEDRVVLCSDGLHSCVSDAEIARLVQALPVQQACDQLVALAERRGTTDDTSVQVIEILEL